MARTIEVIKAEIINAVQTDPTLSSLTSASATAIWRRWAYIVAVAIATLENIFDLFRIEIANQIALQKPHTLNWYRGKALDFQFGDTLVDGEDYYDNTGSTPDQIAAKKIVAFAAVREENDTLVIKVARNVSNEVTELTNDQVTSVTSYFRSVKDAGVKLSVRSFAADRLVLNIDLIYEPLILSATGARLDGTSTTPVPDAIRTYLKNLRFDGLFIKSKLVDAIQAVDGVFIPEIRLCQATRSGNPALATIDLYYNPYSGFMKVLDADLVINYIPRNV